jgi:hypothetical protein
MTPGHSPLNSALAQQARQRLPCAVPVHCHCVLRCLLVDPQPTLESKKVPWEREELQGRECQACACYFESVNPTNPTEYQGFCRRSPADYAETRGQVPRLDPVTKRPIVKDGVPVMNNELIKGYVYKPTKREGTCFDGYRPKGTLPGAHGALQTFDVHALLRGLPNLAAHILKAIEEMGLPTAIKEELKLFLSRGH